MCMNNYCVKTYPLTTTHPFANGRWMDIQIASQLLSCCNWTHGMSLPLSRDHLDVCESPQQIDYHPLFWMHAIHRWELKPALWRKDKKLEDTLTSTVAQWLQHTAALSICMLMRSYTYGKEVCLLTWDNLIFFTNLLCAFYMSFSDHSYQTLPIIIQNEMKVKAFLTMFKHCGFTFDTRKLSGILTWAVDWQLHDTSKIHNAPEDNTGRLSACAVSWLYTYMETVCLGLSTKTAWIELEKYCLMFKNYINNVRGYHDFNNNHTIMVRE